MGFLQPFQDRIYALMRIVVGFLFLSHGVQKWTDIALFGEGPPSLSPMLGTAGAIEAIGGALVALGLFAAPAAFLCSGTMAAAYFIAHQPEALHPIVNKGELAAVYCWIFLFIAAKGSGVWSVDAARSG